FEVDTVRLAIDMHGDEARQVLHILGEGRD
ncbi:MAG: hypothetical protein ACI8UD_002303, partial [Planctomycetota bacterium]